MLASLLVLMLSTGGDAVMATPDPSPAATATPEPAPGVAPQRGQPVRLTLDDGSIVDGTLGDLSTTTVLVRLAGGGFRIVERARIVEPDALRVASSRTAPSTREDLAPSPPAPPGEFGVWLTAGGGPGTLGSGVAGAISVRRDAWHATFRYENRQEPFVRRDPVESNWSVGVMAGRRLSLRDGLFALSLEAGGGMLFAQERGAFIGPDERDGETWRLYQTERYRTPAALAHAAISVHPSFCAPESLGLGVGASAVASARRSEALVVVFVQLGAF